MLVHENLTALFKNWCHPVVNFMHIGDLLNEHFYWQWNPAAHSHACRLITYQPFKDWCISISVLKTGIITKAKGSAYIEQGQTKAICAVYGPREIPRRSDFSMRGILNCTLEHTPYAKERRKAPGSQKDDLEAEMSNAIGQALEATVCMVSFFDTIVLIMQLIFLNLIILRIYWIFESWGFSNAKDPWLNLQKNCGYQNLFYSYHRQYKFGFS